MTNNQLKILKAISAAPGKRSYAYHIGKTTDMILSVVSRALLHLRADGYIEYADSPPDVSSAGPERQYYALTAKGMEAIK